MTNTDLEKALKEYYTAEAESFALPKDDILARVSENDMIKALPKRKRIFNYKYVAALAACLIVIISASIFMLGRGNDETSKPILNEITYYDGMQEWYSPGEFVAYRLSLKGNAEIKTELNKSPVKFMSAGQKDEYDFPEWVASVHPLNDRYISLGCAWPKYDYIIAELGHYIYYDIQTGEIFSMCNRIIELDTEKVLGKDISWINIEVVEFGTSLEWCTITIDYEKEYMVNIETGEIRPLPVGNKFTRSSDYKYIAMYHTFNDIKRVFVINTETMWKTEITAETDLYVPQRYGVFSPDGKYYLQSYSFNGTELGKNDTTTRWKVYNLETGESFMTRGIFKKFTAAGDAAIFQTANNQSTGYVNNVIVRLSDGTDVTNEYKLNVQDTFEITRTPKMYSYTMYRVPLFGDGETEIIAEDVRTHQEWGGYYYIYINGSDNVLVFSPENSAVFVQQIENFDKVKLSDGYVGLSVLDEGKKCILVSYNKFDDIENGDNGNTSVPSENSRPETSKPETSIPEIKGDSGFLDIPFDVNVITVPLLEPALAASNLIWGGHIALSPEDLPLDGNGAEYWRPDEGEPSYNQWIQKYTDEWFEENWLIVFLGTRYEFDLNHIGFHFEEGKHPEMLFIYDENDPDFKWDMTYATYAFVEVSKKDIPYDIGVTYELEGIDGNSFELPVFFFIARETKAAEADGYKLPEEPSLKGKLENIELDYSVEIVKMPLVYENHGIVGNFNDGFFVTDPEWLVFDDYHNMCYDTENYEKHITKYTDEWFEDNYLIKFISYVPTFDCKGTGVYTVEEDDHPQTLYFVWDMYKDRDKQEKYWMMHYYVFIEIPKENIEYDLTEFDFQAVSMVKALDYTC